MPAPSLIAAAATDIPALLILPFVLLLLLIAVMPLAGERAKHFWERRYPYVAIGLGGFVAMYYVMSVPDGGAIVLHTGHEYFSFIVLIGALFVVAGGIHLEVKGEATPWVNVCFLGAGAVVANLIGTTGASMVLIRPWVRMNQGRIRAYHVVFFIFLVSNIGGALTPIGDPPLFLGFLRGVPFFWLIPRVLAPWGIAIGLTLAAFYWYDWRNFRHLPSRLQDLQRKEKETWHADGLINLAFLAVIIGAVFLPARYFIREGVMVVAAVASYRLTPKPVHQQNAFSFGPLKEVAFLFAGIFATMMPALGYLEVHGPEFGFHAPAQYYFATGSLSAVLDNAPTYVTFLQLAQATAMAENPAAFAGAMGDPAGLTRVLLAERPLFVVAVSLGAVFFGAMTYIGNGPNFMVKAIAQEAGVPCPSFFGYLFKFAVPILLPILVLVGWWFL